jgi:hypothetical protein
MTTPQIVAFPLIWISFGPGQSGFNGFKNR